MKKVKLLMTTLSLHSAVGMASPISRSVDVVTSSKQSQVPYRMPQSEPAAEAPEINPEQMVQSSVFKELYSKLVDMVQDEWSDLQDAAAKEIGKYKISQKIGTSSLYYQYVVEASFVEGKHTRQDIWVVDLGTVFSKIGLGTQIRFTFNRLFNTKWEAIKAQVYFPIEIANLVGKKQVLLEGKFPWNSNQAKKVLQKDDVARLEVSGHVGPEVSNFYGVNHGGSTAKGSYTREALFIIDLYKSSEKSVRARFLASKNKGKFSAGVTFGLNPDFQLSFLNKLKRYVSLKLNLDYTNSTLNPFNPKEEYPIDTMMADFLYNFSSDQSLDPSVIANSDSAEKAFDQVMRGTKKIGFVSLFDPRVSESELSTKLLEKASLSQEISRADYSAWKNGTLDVKDIRVMTLFKGRMQSKITTVNSSPRAGQMAKGSFNASSTQSFVTSNDIFDKKSYYILDNSNSVFSKSVFFGRWSTLKQIDVDLLVKSNEKKQPVAVLDLVVQNQYRDKSMTGNEISDIKNNLIRNLPAAYQNDPKVQNFYPTTNQENASLIYRFNYGPSFYDYIQAMDQGTLIEKLTKFLESYPKPQNLNIPSSSVDTTQMLSKTFAEYVEIVAGRIKEMTRLPKDGEDPNEAGAQKLFVFDQLKSDTNFEKVIVTEFFAYLAAQSPNITVSKDFGLTLSFSGKKNPTKTISLGSFDSSGVYNAVSFFRTIISDRSFDLRLQSAESVQDGQKKVVQVPLSFSIPEAVSDEAYDE